MTRSRFKTSLAAAAIPLTALAVAPRRRRFEREIAL
jgi:hypothetical protein